MDPTEGLLRKYRELCAAYRDQPEAVPELERLRTEAVSADARSWPGFLDGRIAFVRRDYASALASFEAVLAADPSFVLAVHMQGVCLGSLGRHEEALAACEKAISLLGDADDLALQEQLAKVMVNKGATLGELGRHEDSIAACDQVASRFAAAEDPALQEQVAKAMINRGVSFGELGRRQEEVAAYDEVLARFGRAEDLRLREQVAWATVNRGIALGELGRRDDELAMYDEVMARFGNAEDLGLREAVAEAMFNKEVRGQESTSEGRGTRDEGRGARGEGRGTRDEGREPSGEFVNHQSSIINHQSPEAPQNAPPSPAELVEQIHATPWRVVLVVSGGGSRAIAELLEVPGASRTLLEAVVPYSEQSLIAWLGGRPEESCSARTARAMAMVAFRRAWEYEAGKHPAAGVACTASLATDRPKRGAHRVHLALQTARRTATWSLQLQKRRRSRAEEEQLVGRLLVNVLAEACRVKPRLPLDLLEGEQIDRSQTIAPRPWQDLLLGRVETVCAGGLPARLVLPGAFNPLHVGHRRMAEIAADTLGTPVVMELSIENVDKPPLDYQEIERRLGQFNPEQRVCLTRAATFEEKSSLFPGATFIVGVDTLRRIADARYYGDDPAACLAAIERIAGRGCRFLVFGRNVGTGFMRLSDLDLPEALHSICREVPPEQFREDVSSTEIRKSGGW